MGTTSENLEAICNLEDVFNLGNVLGRLKRLSHEKYAAFLKELFEKGFENWQDIAIEFYEKAGMADDAVNVAFTVGMIERAIRVYENVGRYGHAVYIAQVFGMTERAKQLSKKVCEITDIKN